MSTPDNRYHILDDDSLLDFCKTKAESRETAKAHIKRFRSEGDKSKVFVFDSMAHVGKPNYWEIKLTGYCPVLGRRENGEVGR